LTDFAPSFLANYREPNTAFVDVTHHLLRNLEQVLVGGPTTAVLEWLKEFVVTMATEVDNLETIAVVRGINDDPEHALSVFRDALYELEALRSQIESNEESANNLLIAELAAKIATGAANTAKTAAGITGDVVLSTFFGNYARDELRTAQLFRVATICSIGATVVLSVLFLLLHTAFTDWNIFVPRLTLLAGIAALGTYYARQSSQHRRVGNWAKALHVQLQAFSAFMEPITDDGTRNEIFTAFSARVLGSPPASAKTPPESEVDPNILKMIMAFAPRS
jgi:hypothetical protein